MPLELVLSQKQKSAASTQEHSASSTLKQNEPKRSEQSPRGDVSFVGAAPALKIDLIDPVAKCIFSTLAKEALNLGIPLAFAPVYVNERVQTYLLFEGTFADAEALSPYFKPLSYKELRDCPAKICVLYCARMPYVFDWSLVKSKQYDLEFVETFLINFGPPVVSMGPRKPLSPSLFNKICL